MAAEGIASVINAFKAVGPRIILCAASVTGVLLFAPETFLSRIGLKFFVDSQRSIIGVVFLVAAVLAVTDSLLWGLRWIKRSRERKKLEAGRLRVLRALTTEEKEYLAPYILDGENTCYYGIDDGVAGGLVSKGILYRSASVGSLVDGFAFNMQPWVREALSESPGIFQGISQRPPTPQERFWSR